MAESWISEWRALDRRHRAHHVSYVPTHAATGGRRDRTNTRSHGHYCVRPTVPPTSTISECSEAAGAIGGPSTALWGEVGLTAGLTSASSWAHSLLLVDDVLWGNVKVISQVSLGALLFFRGTQGYM